MGATNGVCNDLSVGGQPVKALQVCTLEQATPMENRVTCGGCKAHAESLGHNFATWEVTYPECYQYVDSASNPDCVPGVCSRCGDSNCGADYPTWTFHLLDGGTYGNGVYDTGPGQWSPDSWYPHCMRESELIVQCRGVEDGTSNARAAGTGMTRQQCRDFAQTTGRPSTRPKVPSYPPPSIDVVFNGETVRVSRCDGGLRGRSVHSRAEILPVHTRANV